jgi:hypothetical protein
MNTRLLVMMHVKVGIGDRRPEGPIYTIHEVL